MLGRFDLGDVVRNVAALARWLLPWDATLQLDLPPGRFPVEADRAQVVGVLHELVYEAADTLSPGSTLWMRLREDSTGHYAILEVHDDGPDRSLLSMAVPLSKRAFPAPPRPRTCSPGSA